MRCAECKCRQLLLNFPGVWEGPWARGAHRHEEGRGRPFFPGLFPELCSGLARLRPWPSWSEWSAAREPSGAGPPDVRGENSADGGAEGARPKGRSFQGDHRLLPRELRTKHVSFWGLGPSHLVWALGWTVGPQRRVRGPQASEPWRWGLLCTQQAPRLGGG